MKEFGTKTPKYNYIIDLVIVVVVYTYHHHIDHIRVLKSLGLNALLLLEERVANETLERVLREQSGQTVRTHAVTASESLELVDWDVFLHTTQTVATRIASRRGQGGSSRHRSTGTGSGRRCPRRNGVPSYAGFDIDFREPEDGVEDKSRSKVSCLALVAVRVSGGGVWSSLIPNT